MKSSGLIEFNFYRYEDEGSVLIKGPRSGNVDTWPTFKIPSTPAYQADIWIQLAEHKNNTGNMPIPSPNGLFLKTGKGVNKRDGIEVLSNGDENGEK